MGRRYLLILSVALGLGLVVGLLLVTEVAGDPIPGTKVQIPRIDVGDIYETGDWETLIQVQNVGITDTGAVMFLWGEYSGKCPTNDPGPIAHYCMLIVENALWTLKHQLIPEVKSGIVYSVGDKDGDGDVADDFSLACQLADHLHEPRYSEKPTVNWLEWKRDWEGETAHMVQDGERVEVDFITPGEDLAVVVNRSGPNEWGTIVSSAYTGISRWMEGDMYPFEYFAPYVMKGYNDLDTEFTIQNSGQDCTSIWIDYMEQGDCRILYEQHITELAPGEAIRTKVPCDPGQLPCPFLGSARIRAHEPLGIIIDQTSFSEPCGSTDRGILKTARARALAEERPKDTTTEPIADTLFFADLLFREWSGWTSSIQVQNLSPDRRLTFVTVDFMDASGDEVTYVGDWICDIGARTFYLPAITDLGKEYVGAAEIESHTQIGHPGEHTDAEPIFVIVDMNKPDDPDTPYLDAQGASYNAHPFSQKVWHDWHEVDIALPFLGKMAQDKWTSWIAVRNNSNCNKINVLIELKDETGEVVCLVGPFWLRPKAVKLIDLAQQGCISYGWLGAGRVQVVDQEIWCSEDVPLYKAAMPSVVVVERGTGSGDITKIYEGIPISYSDMQVCKGGVYGYIWDLTTDDLLKDVTVSVGGKEDTTDHQGNYEITDVLEGLHTLTAEKEGYLTRRMSVTIPCCNMLENNFELACTNPLTFTVEDSTDGPISGATVTVTYTNPYDGSTETESDETKANGQVVFEIPILDTGLQDVDYHASATGFVSDTGTFTDWTPDPDPCATSGEITIQIDPLGTIQGRIFCDAANAGNDQYDLGEEQKDVEVKLYEDGGAGVTGNFIDSKFSDEDGFYKFDDLISTTSGDRTQPGWYDIMIGGVLEADGIKVTPDEVDIRNFNICD